MSLLESKSYFVNLSYNLSNAVLFNVSVSIPYSDINIVVKFNNKVLIDSGSNMNPFSVPQPASRQTLNFVVGFNISSYPNIIGKLVSVSEARASTIKFGSSLL